MTSKELDKVLNAKLTIEEIDMLIESVEYWKTKKSPMLIERLKVLRVKAEFEEFKKSYSKLNYKDREYIRDLVDMLSKKPKKET